MLLRMIWSPKDPKESSVEWQLFTYNIYYQEVYRRYGNIQTGEEVNFILGRFVTRRIFCRCKFWGGGVGIFRRNWHCENLPEIELRFICISDSTVLSGIARGNFYRSQSFHFGGFSTVEILLGEFFTDEILHGGTFFGSNLPLGGGRVWEKSSTKADFWHDLKNNQKL